MSKERLEEIKQTINHPNYTEHNGQEEIYFMVSDNDFNWLIQQAERVQELEEIKSEAIKQIDVTQERNKRLEKRVRELEQEVNDLRDEAIKWNKRFEESEESHLETKELLHSVVMLNKRYKQALEFYANKNIWVEQEVTVLMDEEPSKVYDTPLSIEDGGTKARKALEGEE